MNNEEKILSSLEKVQRDVDLIKQEIKSQNTNQVKDSNTFKTIVHRVENSNDVNKAAGSSKLEGDIDTI